MEDDEEEAGGGRGGRRKGNRRRGNKKGKRKVKVVTREQLESIPLGEENFKGRCTVCP